MRFLFFGALLGGQLFAIECSTLIQFEGKGRVWAKGGFEQVSLVFEMSEKAVKIITSHGSELNGVVAKRIPDLDPPRYSWRVRSPVTYEVREVSLEVSPKIKEGETGEVTIIDGEHRNPITVPAAERQTTLQFRAEGRVRLKNEKGDIQADVHLNKENLWIFTSPHSEYNEVEAFRLNGSNPPQYYYSIHSPVMGWRKVYIEVSPELWEGKPGSITVIDGSHRDVLEIK